MTNKAASAKIETNNERKKIIHTTFCASESSLGKTITYSNNPDATIAIITEIATNTANEPKLAGLYILVKKGLNKIGISCDIPVPNIS